MNEFNINSFEDYLHIVRDELGTADDNGKRLRRYFRGQSKRANVGYVLKPSIGRYDHLLDITPFDRDKLEQDVLDTFSNHLPTRFMDWTTNPLVALYFATRETKKDSDNNPLDSAVYVLISDPPRLNDLKRMSANIIPIKDLETTLADMDDDPYKNFGIDDGENVENTDYYERSEEEEQTPIAVSPKEIPTPFEIDENIIYDPPHVSPRIRAQDGVLLACHQPLQSLEEKDFLEIIISQNAHDDIRRRLDQYGVFDKQLFPDLDGIAKWLKYRVFEIKGMT